MPAENEGMGAVAHVLCIESSCLHIRQSLTKTNQRPCSLAQGGREDLPFSVHPFKHVLLSYYTTDLHHQSPDVFMGNAYTDLTNKSLLLYILA